MARLRRRRGPATVIPFPSEKRRRLVVKTAERLARASAKSAEKILAVTLQQQSDAMARRDIAPERIKRERRALESAIRAELWRHVLTPDGVA